MCLHYLIISCFIRKSYSTLQMSRRDTSEEMKYCNDQEHNSDQLKGENPLQTFVEIAKR